MDCPFGTKQTGQTWQTAGGIFSFNDAQLFSPFAVGRREEAIVLSLVVITPVRGYNSQ